MTTQVMDDRRKTIVRYLRDRFRHAPGGALEELLPQLGAAQPEQALVVLVGHAVYVLAQGHATGPVEEFLEAPPVLGLGDVPSRRGESVGHPAHGYVGHHPVEALAVGVHNQHHVAQSCQGRLHYRLPDVALVKLGVAN